MRGGREHNKCTEDRGSFAWSATSTLGLSHQSFMNERPCTPIPIPIPKLKAKPSASAHASDTCLPHATSWLDKRPLWLYCICICWFMSAISWSRAARAAVRTSWSWPMRLRQPTSFARMPAHSLFANSRGAQCPTTRQRLS